MKFQDILIYGFVFIIFFDIIILLLLFLFSKKRWDIKKNAVDKLIYNEDGTFAPLSRYFFYDNEKRNFHDTRYFLAIESLVKDERTLEELVSDINAFLNKKELSLGDFYDE